VEGGDLVTLVVSGKMDTLHHLYRDFVGCKVEDVWVVSLRVWLPIELERTLLGLVLAEKVRTPSLSAEAAS
jgi:hypothetical protein